MRRGGDARPVFQGRNLPRAGGDTKRRRLDGARAQTRGRGNTGEAAPQPSPRRVLAAFALAVLLLEAPVASAPWPPMLDYPNHLARMHLIAVGGDAFWRVRWAILPNLAEDGFVWLLRDALPVETMARLFLALTVALTAAGALLLARALQGGFRWWSLTALLFVWCASLLWGFLNYSFGIGLALLGAAAWVGWEARPLGRALAALPIAIACWFAHIEAFAVYAILIVGLEAAPVWDRLSAGRAAEAGVRVAAATAPFLIPLALTLFGWTARPQQNWELSGLWRKPDLLFSAFDNYNRAFDVFSLVALLTLFGALLATRRLGIARRAVPALALLAAAFVAAPNHLYSGGGADHRLPAAIFMLFTAAGAPAFRSREEAWRVYGALAALFVLRMGLIENAWLAAQDVYARDMAILQQVDRGASVAIAQPPDAIKFSAAPQLHVPLLATVLRGAFLPTLFAYPEQQPIAATARGAELRSFQSEGDFWSGFVEGDAEARARARPKLAHFDYLLLVGRKPFEVTADPQLAPLDAAATFKLYAVRPMQSGGPPSSP